MIRTLCLAALLLACTPALLAAQDEGAEAEFCPKGRTQLAMNNCAAAELARADTLLNERYQQLLRTMEPERVEALRAAQRAWIRFRDAECDFQASEVAGGSMERMVHALCLAHLTRKRADEFQVLLVVDG